MNTLRKFARLLPLGLLVACTAHYTRELTHDALTDTHLIEHPEVIRENTWVLPQTSRLEIAYPALGQADQSRRLNRTQYQLAELLRAGFSRYFPATKVLLVEQDLTGALTQARRDNQDFLVYPELLVVSHNPTAADADENSEVENKSQLRLNLQIYDVRSRKLVDTLKVFNRQGWLDFSRQEPQVLMEKAINSAVKKISGG